MKSTIIIVLLIINSFAYPQETLRYRMTKDQAKIILDKSLADTALHSVIGNTRILTDEVQVIEFAELVLFNIYGKKKYKTTKTL